MKLLSLFCVVSAFVTFLGHAHECDCHKEFVRSGDWILVFRAEADVGVSVYDTWMNDRIYHDSPVKSTFQECTNLNATCATCNTHFKSRIVTKWDNYKVQKVKILLMKQGTVKAQVVFNGKGSTKTNWFSQSRVISSTWTDLKTAPANYFSIIGHTTRRFFLNSEYHGCSNDLAWMMIIDGHDKSRPCPWDNPARFPKIVYTTKTSRTKTHTWLDDFEYGDVMAILVQL